MQTEQESGVSPVVGVILMVAVTVILSTVIGVFVLDLGENTQDNPRASVLIDQDIKGNGGDFAAEVQVHSMDNADYIVLKTNTTPEPNEWGMEPLHDENIMYRWNNGTIEWSEFESDGINKYKLAAPENSGTVNIGLEYYTWAYEGSGTIVYAKDEGGNIITPTNADGVNIWCDGEHEDTSSPPTDLSEHSGLSCSDKDNASNSESYYWNDTVSLTASTGSITGVYIATDIENVHEEYWDRAQLHHLHVESASTGETRNVCTECFAQFKSSENDTDYSNDTVYYGTNDMQNVGSTTAIRHLKPNTKVTVMAVKDGKKTVLQTYTVRDQG